ncbi:MAG: divergent polysaccharide deacetylase family protein, partial [Pseudomonadota bacterium]|nr:divergent polysaccharide deacetylase family protein [Pseudomonadota bacterium]
TSPKAQKNKIATATHEYVLAEFVFQEKTLGGRPPTLSSKEPIEAPKREKSTPINTQGAAAPNPVGIPKTAETPEKDNEIPEATKMTTPQIGFSSKTQTTKNQRPSVAAKPAEIPLTRPDQPKNPKPLARVISDGPLLPAPDKGLVQTTAIGPLPRIGYDGRKPVDVYAKPFNRADKRPRIGIVVTGLGLSDAATESAIQGLPGAVTLAFAPHSSKLKEWVRLARAAGHEVLINIPMEPVNYPSYDPGPQTLLTSLNANQNLNRLFWGLSRASGYVGVVDFLGSRFTASRKHMEPVLNELKRRGLLYLDSGTTTGSTTPVIAHELGIAFAVSKLTLDETASRKNIDRRFGELETRARRDTQAIGIASPYPVTLERIANWARQLRARGFALAPISALTIQSSQGKVK